MTSHSDLPRGIIDKGNNTFIVSVLGYRRVRFDTVHCIHRLRDDLAMLRDIAKEKGRNIALLADGTDIGVAGLAYREARRLGYETMGITPETAVLRGEPMFPCKYQVSIDGDFDSQILAVQYAMLSDVCLFLGNKNPTSTILMRLSSAQVQVWHSELPLLPS